MVDCNVRPEIAELFAMHTMLLDGDVEINIGVGGEQFALENAFRSVLANVIRDYLMNKYWYPGVVRPEGQTLQ